MSKFKCIILILVMLLPRIAVSQTKFDKNLQKLFDKGKVKSIRFDIPHKSYSAHAVIDIKMSITTTKNKVINLEGHSCFKHFHISAVGANLDVSGKIIIADMKHLIRHSILIQAVSNYNQSFSIADTIKIDYKDTLKLYYNGSDGEPGVKGKCGANGYLKAHRTYEAESGQPGQDGKNGLSGQALDVKIFLLWDSILHKSMLHVNIFSYLTLLMDDFIVDPVDGFAIIAANGGTGGMGGCGGDGGEGIDGICKVGYNGFGTWGGTGGVGGKGGNGGTGGMIMVFFDSLCTQYVNHFIFLNKGGAAGKSGVTGAPGRHGQDYQNGVPLPIISNRNNFENGLDGVGGDNGPTPEIKVMKLNEIRIMENRKQELH